MGSTQLQAYQPPTPAVAESLDTLAQVTPNPRETLQKKAKRKAITVFLSTKLIQESTINLKAYRNMYYCNSVLQQEGQELKTSYCKNRFCLVCNAIKTANLINGYLPELQQMESPYFLTLTVKAVRARFLKPAIDRMANTMRTIQKNLSKYHKIKVVAIRKLECNYNLQTNTYNPHYHLIIDGLQPAAYMLNLWLQLNPMSDERAQDLRIADNESMPELFKYATKIVSKKGIIHAKQLDVIYTALRNKRSVQPIGIKKFVDEDAREKEIYTNLKNEENLWKWDDQNYDWYSEITGELLSGYTPDKETMSLFNGSEVAKPENIELRE